MERDVSSSGKLQERKLETKDCCFLCLAVTDIKIEEEDLNFDVPIKRKVTNKETVSLKSLQRYLKINTEELYCKGQKGASDEIEVDLCWFCAKIFKNFSNLFESLEKIEMEMHYWLERIQHQISEASKKPELVQTYSKRMTSDAKALAQLVFVDNLRKEIAKKSLRTQRNQKPKVHLHRLLNSEVEKYLRKGKRKPEGNFPTTQHIQSSTEEEPEFEDYSLPIDDDYEPDFKNAVSTFDQGEDDIKKDLFNLSTKSSQSVSSIRNNVNLKSYVKRSRMGLKKRHRCDKCGSLYISKEALKGHMPKCGDTNNRPTHAKSGTYSFFDGKAKKFNCRICKKAFTAKNSVAIHYHSVHLRTEYKCEDCKLVLSDRNAIRRHRQTCQSRIQSLVANGKPVPRFRHSCPTCGKGFAQKCNMERHQKVVHLKQKNYACNQCEKKFGCLKSLTYHKRKNHFGVLFDCTFCKERFGSIETLRLHQQQCAKSVKLEPKIDVH